MSASASATTLSRPSCAIICLLCSASAGAHIHARLAWHLGQNVTSSGWYRASLTRACHVFGTLKQGSISLRHCSRGFNVAELSACDAVVVIPGNMQPASQGHARRSAFACSLPLLLRRPFLLPCLAVSCVSLAAALSSILLLSETLPKRVHKQYLKAAADEPVILASTPLSKQGWSTSTICQHLHSI